MGVCCVTRCMMYNIMLCNYIGVCTLGASRDIIIS